MAESRGKSHQQKAEEITFERGLPCNLQAERFVLGSILLNGSAWDAAAAVLTAEDFSTEKHRRIWQAMAGVLDLGQHIDRVTVANELQKRGQLESVDGLTYLVSLDDGLPELANIGSYVQIVKEKATLRAIIFKAHSAIEQAYVEIPSEDIARGLAETMYQVQGAQGQESGRRAGEIVESYGLSKFMDPQLRDRGLSYGFTRLDEMTEGMHPGELIIIAARPSVGKSTMLLNIAENVAIRKNQGVHLFSLEMSAESVLTRMMCAHARVDQHKFRAGYLNQDDRHRLQVALDDLMEAPLVIDDRFRKDLAGLERGIRAAVRKGAKLIGLDYLQLMVVGHKSENRNQEISEIVRRLKILLSDLGIPGLILSQIGRSAEKRPGGNMRPQLSDLKDSGSIEEHADTVHSLYREEIYRRDREDLKGLADLDILKQRNGPTGTVPLRFIGAYTRFENRAKDTAFPEEPPDPSGQTAW